MIQTIQRTLDHVIWLRIEGDTAKTLSETVELINYYVATLSAIWGHISAKNSAKSGTYLTVSNSV